MYEIQALPKTDLSGDGNSRINKEGPKKKECNDDIGDKLLGPVGKEKHIN